MIEANEIRYIKLGRKGKWERECIEKGILRLGFQTQNTFSDCMSNNWQAVSDYWTSKGKVQQSATNYTNQIESFFTDGGSVLWVTICDHSLYWGFLENTPTEKHLDGEGVFRRVQNGWSNTDVTGVKLSSEKLSGNVLKLAMFQGTSCKIRERPRRAYIINKINGLSLPEVAQSQRCYVAAKESIIPLLNLLTWQDFELLVELIFSVSGWRRIGVLGKTAETNFQDAPVWSTHSLKATGFQDKS